MKNQIVSFKKKKLTTTTLKQFSQKKQKRTNKVHILQPNLLFCRMLRKYNEMEINFHGKKSKIIT